MKISLFLITNALLVVYPVSSAQIPTTPTRLIKDFFTPTYTIGIPYGVAKAYGKSVVERFISFAYSVYDL